MAAGWPSRRLAWRRPVLMPGTWRGGAPRRWRDPRPLRHPGRPGISRHKQGARGLPAERHAAAGAPNPSTASTRPASARTTYRTHPDTAITAEPALAYCQGRALPSRYETLPEMASAVQGNETIPYRRLGAAEIWSCPRCEQAQSVRFWAVPDSVPARGLPGLQRARLPSCVMPCSRRSSGDTPGGLGVLRLFCPSACCGRDGAEAAGWRGGEAARAGA